MKISTKNLKLTILAAALSLSSITLICHSALAEGAKNGPDLRGEALPSLTDGNIPIEGTYTVKQITNAMETCFIRQTDDIYQQVLHLPPVTPMKASGSSIIYASQLYKGNLDDRSVSLGIIYPNVKSKGFLHDIAMYSGTQFNPIGNTNLPLNANRPYSLVSFFSSSYRYMNEKNDAFYIGLASMVSIPSLFFIQKTTVSSVDELGRVTEREDKISDLVLINDFKHAEMGRSITNSSNTSPHYFNDRDIFLYNINQDPGVPPQRTSVVFHWRDYSKCLLHQLGK